MAKARARQTCEILLTSYLYVAMSYVHSRRKGLPSAICQLS